MNTHTVEEPTGHKLSATQLLFYSNSYHNRSNTVTCDFVYPKKIDLDILRAALKSLIEVNSILRCKFLDVNNEPRQYIQPSTLIDQVEILTNRDICPEETNALSGITKLTLAASNTNFTLSKPPLFKIFLHLDLPDETFFCLGVDHLIFDGVSRDVFFGQLFKIYENLSENKEPLSNVLATQFLDYIAEQERKSKEDSLEEKSFNWFKKNLNGYAPEGLQPKRAANTDQDGEMIFFFLDKDFSNKIRKFCFESHISVNILFIAAASVLLARNIKRDGLSIFSIFHNRTSLNTDNMIGNVIKMIIILIKIEDNVTVQKFLKNIQKDYIQSCMYSSLSLEKIIEAFQNVKTPEYPTSLLVSYEPNNLLSYALSKKIELSDTDSGYQFHYRAKEFVSLGIRVDDKFMGDASGKIAINATYAKDTYDRQTMIEYLDLYKNIILELITNDKMNIANT